MALCRYAHNLKLACLKVFAALRFVDMKEQSKTKGRSVEQKIKESAPQGSIGYKLFCADTNTYYPVKATQGREFFQLGKGFESPAGVPTGTYQIHFIDAGGKPIYLSPLPTVRIGVSAATRHDPTDDSEDEDTDPLEEDSSEESEEAATSLDDALAVLMSAAGDVETKKKRHKLASKMRTSKHVAEHYELFDTMKSDMLRQILALSKISQKHNEIQLAITDKLKESLDKNIAAAANPAPTKEMWAPVALELLHTLGDLGKTAMSARALQLTDTPRPALPPRSEPDEVIRQAKEAAEKVAQKSAEQVNSVAEQAAQRATESASAQAEQALARAARVESEMASLRELLHQVLSAQRAAVPPPPAAPVVESVKVAPPPVSPVVESAQATPPPVSPVVESVKVAPPPVSPVVEAVKAEPPPVSPVVEPTPMPSRAPPSASSEPASDDDKPDDPPPPAASAGESAPPGPNPTDPGAAARSSALALRSQDPHVQSWRTIKRFVRRMTDFDLLAFTSSVPMFRGFLAMLRAMTPYYKGPSLSLDELAAAGAGP